jgi:LDH2 family malate/lactate/ureidoglycolate dehydrogenase
MRGIKTLTETVRIKREDMLHKSARILELVGTSTQDSLSVAESLVKAQEVGHSSHGILRLIEYVDCVEKGEVIPTAQPKVLSERGAVIALDGQWGWGQIACKQAVDLVAAKAEQFGVATVTIKSCNHIGRLGEYVEMLSKKSLISIMWCNGGSSVAAFGGKTRLFGTNPFAAGIPTGDEDIVVDFATAATAEGKLRVAHLNGLKVGEGLIIDSEGRPTIDPADFYAGGAILPFGGHKGYCLNLIIDILGGALSGSHPSMNKSYNHGNGTVLIAMDPDFFTGSKEFLQETREARQEIKDSDSIDADKPVFLPGEIEEQERARNATGINISETIWNSILKLENQLLTR